MSKQYYEIGQTFVDKESGRTLKCVEGISCIKCDYTKCTKIRCSECERIDGKEVVFIRVDTISCQESLTHQLLLRNGWTQIDNENVFELDKIRIFCVDGFTCGLQTKQNELIGEPFTTVGELKAIAKALYKVELEFK